MSTNTIRILIAGALFVHGIGHTLGFWMPARSWLMPNAGESSLRVLSSALWGLAAVGFILSLLGFLGVVVPTEVVATTCSSLCLHLACWAGPFLGDMANVQYHRSARNEPRHLGYSALASLATARHVWEVGPRPALG